MIDCKECYYEQNIFTKTVKAFTHSTDGNMAKGYQVRQVRTIILKYNLV
ncbi:MAG: hypothetical protein FWE24_01070 [Defluviitaleaceae bacterium]|nr:hypothetical protein [Defluviitaleaceae bacterium]